MCTVRIFCPGLMRHLVSEQPPPPSFLSSRTVIFSCSMVMTARCALSLKLTVTPIHTALYPQRLAQPKLVPIVASVSAPSPGLHLIEVDAVYVVAPHKPWFAPITWLLPDESPCNIHMKIGVKGSLEDGQVGPLQSVCSC